MCTGLRCRFYGSVRAAERWGSMLVPLPLHVDQTLLMVSTRFQFSSNSRMTLLLVLRPAKVRGLTARNCGAQGPTLGGGFFRGSHSRCPRVSSTARSQGQQGEHGVTRPQTAFRKNGSHSRALLSPTWRRTRQRAVTSSLRVCPARAATQASLWGGDLAPNLRS